MTSTLSSRVDAILLARRREIVTFAAAIAEKHDTHAYEHLVSRSPQNGWIKDDTPANLEAKLSHPGAFFNKRLRPIPLGSK